MTNTMPTVMAMSTIPRRKALRRPMPDPTPHTNLGRHRHPPVTAGTTGGVPLSCSG